MKTTLLTIAFSTLLLSACGGGKSSSSSQALNGIWASFCQYDSNENAYIHEGLKIEGNDINLEILYYNTSDCSGDEILSVELEGDIDYVGEYSTSVCTADKINTSYDTLRINDKKQSDVVFNQFMSDAGIPSTLYDIACVHKGKLFSGSNTNGNNGTSDNTRPTTLDLANGLERF